MAALNSSKLNLLRRSTIIATSYRTHYWKFERVYVPPLQEPKESPYIVGPYLKPKYLPPKYITDAIEHHNIDDFDHHIYKPTKIEADESRTVKLLLIGDVEGLGVAGQIVDAPYRYGASKLVAMKKAEYATDFAEKWYKFGPKTTESASTALSPRTARLLRTTVFKLPIGLDVEVQSWHISLALRLSGCICPLEAIEQNSIEESTTEDGEIEVKCTIVINNHERVEVKFCKSGTVSS